MTWLLIPFIITVIIFESPSNNTLEFGAVTFVLIPVLSLAVK